MNHVTNERGKMEQRLFPLRRWPVYKAAKSFREKMREVAKNLSGRIKTEQNTMNNTSGTRNKEQVKMDKTQRTVQSGRGVVRV